jgi:glucuronokinase
MRRFAELAEEAHDALLAGDQKAIGPLMDENFDLRRSICRLPSLQVEMIGTARAAGASAKFAGSGGAIVGTYDNQKTLEKLKAMLPDGSRVIPLRAPSS